MSIVVSQSFSCETQPNAFLNLKITRITVGDVHVLFATGFWDSSLGLAFRFLVVLVWLLSRFLF